MKEAVFFVIITILVILLFFYALKQKRNAKNRDEVHI